MKTNPEQILYSDISRIMYEQAKRLLVYVNDNLKGKEVTINYGHDGSNGFASVVDFLGNETLQININYDFGEKNYQIILYNHFDPKGFEVSLSICDRDELYDYIPATMRDAFRKCIRRKEEVLFIL